MKTLLLTLICIQSLFALDLRPGDILLQPLHCRLCNLIEAQTNSIYSHIGIVINENFDVAEAFIKVRKVSLKDFNTKTQKNQKIKVVRPRFSVANLEKTFDQKYSGLSYDSEFRWNNFDTKGLKIYCSELVFLLLEPFSSQIPHPIPMAYDVNTDLWSKFFKGDIPFGEPGISPAAFDNEAMFEYIGEI